MSGQKALLIYHRGHHKLRQLITEAGVTDDQFSFCNKEESFVYRYVVDIYGSDRNHSTSNMHLVSADESIVPLIVLALSEKSYIVKQLDNNEIAMLSRIHNSYKTYMDRVNKESGLNFRNELDSFNERYRNKAKAELHQMFGKKTIALKIKGTKNNKFMKMNHNVLENLRRECNTLSVFGEFNQMSNDLTCVEKALPSRYISSKRNTCIAEIKQSLRDWRDTEVLPTIHYVEGTNQWVH